MGWRDHLPIHPAADLFPLMSESELRELGEDIKQNGGLHYPIVLYRGQLLDGRNRLDAMELVGIALDWTNIERLRPIVCELTCGDDPYNYVISLNLKRRHLTSEQKRDLIEKVLKAKPAASNAAVAKQTKTTDKTVAKVRNELEARSEIPNVETRTDTKGRVQPARKKIAAKPKPKRRQDREWEGAKASDIAAAEAMSRATGGAEISIEERQAQNAALDVEPDSADPDEDSAGFIVAVAKNATEKAQIAIRNLPKDLTESERAEIVEAIYALIRKWESVIRKLEPKAGQ